MRWPVIIVEDVDSTRVFSTYGFAKTAGERITDRSVLLSVLIIIFGGHIRGFA